MFLHGIMVLQYGHTAIESCDIFYVLLCTTLGLHHVTFSFYSTSIMYMFSGMLSIVPGLYPFSLSMHNTAMVVLTRHGLEGVVLLCTGLCLFQGTYVSFMKGLSVLSVLRSFQSD